VIVFLVMHGIGHIIWFLAAWTPIKAGIKDGPWILPGSFTIRSIPGRITGLLALIVLLVFVGTGLALLLEQTWWRTTAQVAAIVSLVAIFPWTRQSPRANTLNAILADLAIMFVLALPISVELASPS
jgi:hypothetical protein